MFVTQLCCAMNKKLKKTLKSVSLLSFIFGTGKKYIKCGKLLIL
tara:strand:+ start:123231 stop:123362 length:132 start_codon:yes stop_codon:yes gene_type:complete